MMLEMKIRMVESAAYEAANDLYEYLLKGVTQGGSDTKCLTYRATYDKMCLVNDAVTYADQR